MNGHDELVDPYGTGTRRRSTASRAELWLPSGNGSPRDRSTAQHGDAMTVAARGLRLEAATCPLPQFRRPCG